MDRLLLSLGTLVPMACVASDIAKPDASSSDRGQKPNLIVVMCDDLGYVDVGFNGSEDIPTPNIDRIANEGVKFTSGYTTYSVSGPSRAGFMTGRYGQRFGFERNPQYRPNNPNMGLPLDEMTIAESLSKVGYTSGIIGKWHLGATVEHHPLNRGFNEFFGHLGGGHRYFPEEFTKKDSYAINNETDSYLSWIMRDHEPVDPKETPGYLTDEFSDEAVSFVERHKDEPFFLYLAFNAPHEPLQATQEYLDRFPNLEGKRKTYAAMVSAVDDGVGALLNKLDELGIADNTIVFFLSDNGGPETKNHSNNGPLRDGKGSYFEGGFRVPFAMRYPAQVQPAIYDLPVSSLDIFATIQDITSSPTKNDLDGVNLVPYLNNEKKGMPHEAIYLRQFDKGGYVVRNNDLKLVYQKATGDKKEKSLLFNITKDISEKSDISKWNKKEVERLHNMRRAWEKDLVEPVFEGLIMKNNWNKNKAKAAQNKKASQK